MKKVWAIIQALTFQGQKCPKIVGSDFKPLRGLKEKTQTQFFANFTFKMILTFWLKNLQEKTDQIAEMTEVMRKAVEIDDKHSNDNDEKLQSLITENRGLRELLKIKSKYGVREDNYYMVDKEVSTEDIEQNILVRNQIEEPAKIEKSADSNREDEQR